MRPSKGEGFYSARSRRSATSDVDRGMTRIKWKASAPRIDAESRSRSACLKSLALELQRFHLLVSQFHRIAGYNCNSFATRRPLNSTTAMDHQDSTEEAKRPIRSAGANCRHAHPPVICSQCGHTFCLEDVPIRLSGTFPAGYRSQTVEFSIRGLCGDCSPEQASR